jgi:hypothetical protein
VGFEPTISAGERPKTYALDRAATGTGIYYICGNKMPTRRNRGFCVGILFPHINDDARSKSHQFTTLKRCFHYPSYGEVDA